MTTATSANATPTADINRAIRAASLAKTVLPGPVGEFLHNELYSWANSWHRFDFRGTAMALAADIERRHAEMSSERTYG